VLLGFIHFVCWNGSLVDSDTKDKRPDVNFYGTIEDHNKTFKVEDILIGGRYQDIAVYPTISKSKKINTDQKEQVDPKQNKALIDLHEIKSIELKHPDHPTASTIEINKRDYIEIIITSINDTRKDYLIETSRKVTCKEIDKGPKDTKEEVLVERELNMIHIKKMTIKGYKSIKEKDQHKEYGVTTSHNKHQKHEISKDTSNILDQIEKNVKDLSHDNPSTLEQMKSSILTLLKTLREQLQKILNMLQ
tara:strand:+ start:332 stop:1075 length:744 start_codon:yes stop_codon:yes gene_type:complete